MGWDPLSFQNFDQDQPNNLQDRVPIYRLPQEWLWCESWCGNGTAKERAKIIDLCFNPMAREDKIVSAKRIIEEWSILDAQVHSIITHHRDEL